MRGRRRRWRRGERRPWSGRITSSARGAAGRHGRRRTARAGGEQTALAAPATAAGWYGAALRLLPEVPEHDGRRLALLRAQALALAAAGRAVEARDVLRRVLAMIPAEAAAERVAVAVVLGELEALWTNNAQEARRLLEAERAALGDGEPGLSAALTLVLARERAVHGDHAAAEALADEAQASAARRRRSGARSGGRSDGGRRGALPPAPRRPATRSPRWTSRSLERGRWWTRSTTSGRRSGRRCCSGSRSRGYFTGSFEPARAAAERGLRVARRSGQGLYAPAFVCAARLGGRRAGPARRGRGRRGGGARERAAVRQRPGRVLDVDRAKPDGAGARRGSTRRSTTARPRGRGSAPSSTRRPATRLPTPGWPPAIRRARLPRWRPSAGCSPRCGRSTASRRPRSPCASCSRSGGWRRPRRGQSGRRARAAVDAPGCSAPSSPTPTPASCSPRDVAPRAAAVALDGAAAADQGDAPLWAGRCRTLAGAALAADGRAEDARVELRRAATELEARGAWGYRDDALRVLRRLGERPRPATRSAPGQPDGPRRLSALTPREREVAALVADGQTNAQIAAPPPPEREHRGEARIPRAGQARAELARRRGATARPRARFSGLSRGVPRCAAACVANRERKCGVRDALGGGCGGGHPPYRPRGVSATVRACTSDHIRASGGRRSSTSARPTARRSQSGER